MIHYARQILIVILYCLLAACQPPPIVDETFPAARTPPLTELAAQKIPEENRLMTAMFEIGDMAVISRTLKIDAAELAAADLNNDGYLDLVSAVEPQITFYLGDGTGKLTASSQAPGGEQPDAITLTDLNEDGDVDLVIANHDTDHLTILLGDGSGTFKPATNSPLQIDVRPHPHAVRAVDLDRDGSIDLIVDDREGEGIQVLRGLGQGKFEKPGIFFPVGGDPYRGMAIGDINRDGLMDVLTPNPREVGILFNMSTDKISLSMRASVPAQAPFAIAVGDFNGDDTLDLLAASDEGSAVVELFYGDGLGGFTEDANSPYLLAPGGKNMVVGDFNGDGIDDAVVVSYHATEIMVLLGGRETIQTGILLGGKHPWALAAADFNSDGKDDLVVADDGAGTATLFLSVAK
jgi:hypothetical protein